MPLLVTLVNMLPLAICPGPEQWGDTANETISMRRRVKALHLEDVLTPSSGEVLMVQQGVGASPSVRLVPLDACNLSYCARYGVLLSASDEPPETVCRDRIDAIVSPNQPSVRYRLGQSKDTFVSCSISL